MTIAPAVLVATRAGVAVRAFVRGVRAVRDAVAVRAFVARRVMFAVGRF